MKKSNEILIFRFLIKEYEKDRFGESNFSNWNMIDELDN